MDTIKFYLVSAFYLAIVAAGLYAVAYALFSELLGYTLSVTGL